MPRNRLISNNNDCIKDKMKLCPEEIFCVGGEQETKNIYNSIFSWDP